MGGIFVGTEKTYHCFVFDFYPLKIILIPLPTGPDVVLAGLKQVK